MPEAGRVGDIAWVSADSHGHDCCSHSAQGPAVAGSPDCFINGMPALRVGDPGTHSACCGSNSWRAATGAPGVFINDIPAHRVQDSTIHCGGTGALVIGSPNVIIGNYGGPTKFDSGRPPLPSNTPYIGGFLLVYEGTDTPVVGRRYVIYREDGTSFEGVTNERGRTVVIETEKSEQIRVEVLED